MELPIIFFVAVVKDGVIYWRDDRLYKTEDGARKRLEFLKKEHTKHICVLYADDFKMT